MFHRSVCLTLVLLVACGRNREETSHDASAPPESEPIPRTGIDGCNCAGASPVMHAPDGDYPFQSVVSYYYEMIRAAWTRVDDDDVLVATLDPAITATNEAFYEWLAKTVQIYRDRDLLGWGNGYYRGIFGFLTPPAQSETCTPTLDAASRLVGMLAHVALSQAGMCGLNENGTKKFFQVNGLSLLLMREVIDARVLISAGLAQYVTTARADRCILPDSIIGPDAGVIATPISDAGVPTIPCRIAFRDDAVTEAVVFPVPTQEVVSGVPLSHRAFTAAGIEPMPNGLDQVRKILRDAQLRAMFAIGVPQFVAMPQSGPWAVEMVGHRIGPARAPSAILRSEERAWVDSRARIYSEACCRIECDPAMPDAGVHDTRIASAFATGDGGVMVVDAGPPPPVDAGPIDAGSSGECREVCLEEGVCETGVTGEGIVVMVSSVTTAECAGSCPEPATVHPASEPTCAP